MGLKERVAKLEAIQACGPEVLSGVLIFYPGIIFVDGTAYDAIEDVPPEVRTKYPSLAVGKVLDQRGHTVIITAEEDWPGYLLVPQPTTEAEWEAAAKAEIHEKEAAK